MGRIFILLFLALLSLPARADEYRDIATVRSYALYWLGLYVGNFYLDITPEKNDGYKVTALIRTKGLAHNLTRFRSDSVTHVRLDKNSYIPIDYTTHYRIRNKTRDVKLTYGPDGTLATDQFVPLPNPKKRPPVPDKLKTHSYDPLTAFLVARLGIVEGKETQRIPIYEGQRRLDGTITRLGKSKDGLLRISAEGKPVAGYTEKELQNYRKEGFRAIEFFLDPRDYFPVRAEVASPVGIVEAKLVGKCPTLENCIQSR